VVVHGVSSKEIDYDNLDEIKVDLEAANIIDITRIFPLQQKTVKLGAHHSIVVFTTDPQAADRCITKGFSVNSHMHNAEKYALQLYLTQCFNCQEYGHHARTCKRKHQCGSCASDQHTTKECTAADKCCAICTGGHEAWHRDCPQRHIEHERMREIRANTHPLFIQ